MERVSLYKMTFKIEAETRLCRAMQGWVKSLGFMECAKIQKSLEDFKQGSGKIEFSFLKDHIGFL